MRMRACTRTLLCAVALLGVTAPAVASAGPFVIRTSRPDYPNKEAERPLILEKEWLELSLSFEMKDTLGDGGLQGVTEYTDADGNVHDANYEYQRQVATFELRYGLTSHWNLWFTLPYITYTSIETAAGASIQEHGLSDLKLGADWEFYGRRNGSVTSAVARFWTKQASGTEARGAAGQPHIVLGTGTTDIGGMVLAKQTLPFSAVNVRVGYIHKFSDVVQYVFDETNGGGLNGRFKPGDDIILGGGVIVQPGIPVPKKWTKYTGGKTVGLVGLAVDAQYTIRDSAMVGKTSNGFLPGIGDCKNDLGETEPCMKDVADSDGEYFDLFPRLLIEPTGNWTLALGAQIPLLSRNSDRIWPIEEHSPSYAINYTGTLFFRW